MNIARKTYLVSGGLGHIGSSLIGKLLSIGHRVIVVDDLSTQRFPSLFGKFQNENFHFIADALQSQSAKDDILKLIEKSSFRIDAIIHLAAMTDAAGSFDREHVLKKNNLEATRAAIDIANHQECVLLYPSSTSVYGENNNFVTELSMVNPQSPYAESKLIEENLVLRTASKAKILRLGTIAGPSIGMRFHTAVNAFVWNSIIKKPVTVWSTAYDQKRPYLCLVDAISAFEHALSNKVPHNEIYNVLTENSTPREICEIIRNTLGFCEIEFVDSKIMNQLTYEVSLEKFKNTGFVTRSSLQEAILDTIQFLRMN